MCGLKRDLRSILIIFFVLTTFIRCEKKDSSFELNGKMSPDIDSIGIYPSFIAKEFIDSTLYNLTSKVESGKFTFKGKMPYPHMMNLYYKSGFSTPFFIEEGKTDISINFENGRDVSFMGEFKSSTQREYELLKTSKLDSIFNNLRRSSNDEEAKEYRDQYDYALIDYLEVNPNSYVVLWIMLDRFCRSDYEYNESYEVALGKFSNEIQDLDIFKKFKDRIAKNKYFSFTNRDIPLKDINGTDTKFNLENFKDKKYLLIDFWYSDCGPCLREMPTYRPVYDKFKSSGFEIVSISIDKKKDIRNWKRVIAEEGFNWKHYLDLGGLEAKKMNIISYPTTYLIDTKGKVIEKNIDVQKLEEFLKVSIRSVN